LQKTGKIPENIPENVDIEDIMNTEIPPKIKKSLIDSIREAEKILTN